MLGFKLRHIRAAGGVVLIVPALLKVTQQNKNKFRPSLKNDYATFKMRPQSKQKDLNNIFQTVRNPGSPGLNMAGSEAASSSNILGTGK